MLAVRWATRFKRDVKRAEKRGKDMTMLKALVALLAKQETLPYRYRDHALSGGWGGYRDAHIEPDWLLIYRIKGAELQLARTGSHAELFER